MNIELVNTGSELLLGSTLNTNAAWIGRQLFARGFRLARQVTVPDGEPIRHAVSEGLSRGGVLLITGGLGPTTDDLTRDLVAELLGRALRRDDAVLATIADRFARRGVPMPKRVERQAEVIEGATVLPNPNGTAPGLYVPATEALAAHLFLLPGPPRELRPMFTDHVLPALESLGGANLLQCRVLRVSGMGESAVEEQIGEELSAMPGLELGYCARPGEVDVRLIGAGEVVGRAAEYAYAKLGGAIYGEGEELIEEGLVRQLRERGETLAVAESCTGGCISNRITNIPGASSVFLAGYVTYANAAKTDLLGVPEELIARHGAVSEEVGRAMSEGALVRAGATHALAATGIAGPGGGSEAKPVGTVVIALASRGSETVVRRLRLSTDRETFKAMAAQAAFGLLRERLGA